MSALLLETGSYLLLEDGTSHLLLEATTAVTFLAQEPTVILQAVKTAAFF